MPKRPVEIRNDRENGRVLVVWDDDSRLGYLYDELRNNCPCAGCRGHAPGEVEPPSVTGVVVSHIAEVGSYAVRFEFSDGHATGIYTWSYLAEIGKEMIA